MKSNELLKEFLRNPTLVAILLIPTLAYQLDKSTWDTLAELLKDSELLFVLVLIIFLGTGGYCWLAITEAFGSVHGKYSWSRLLENFEFSHGMKSRDILISLNNDIGKTKIIQGIRLFKYEKGKFILTINKDELDKRYHRWAVIRKASGCIALVLLSIIFIPFIAEYKHSLTAQNVAISSSFVIFILMLLVNRFDLYSSAKALAELNLSFLRLKASGKKALAATNSLCLCFSALYRDI